MQKENNVINVLWSAIWHSFLFGGLLNLSIAILASFLTNEFALLMFFIALSFIIGLATAFVNTFLLCFLSEIPFLSLFNKTFYKFVFTFVGALFGAIFGAMIMFWMLENDNMVGEMVQQLAQASSGVTAVSYGITNFKFASWHKSILS
ncbi:MAG: hypothetical protein AAFQ91_25355 [Cyanobacteria bacterium J06621_15]